MLIPAFLLLLAGQELQTPASTPWEYDADRRLAYVSATETDTIVSFLVGCDQSLGMPITSPTYELSVAVANGDDTVEPPEIVTLRIRTYDALGRITFTSHEMTGRYSAGVSGWSAGPEVGEEVGYDMTPKHQSIFRAIAVAPRLSVDIKTHPTAEWLPLSFSGLGADRAIGRTECMPR